MFSLYSIKAFVSFQYALQIKSTTIFHGHNVQNFFSVRPLAYGSWFHSSVEQFDVKTSMADKVSSTEHGKLM